MSIEEGALIRAKSGQFAGRWGHLGVHMRGDQHRVYYYKDDEITTLSELEEITHADLSDEEMTEYLDNCYGDFSGLFETYAEVWFLTSKASEAIPELEWLLSCCKDEAFTQIEMIKEVNALGNRPGVSELVKNLESFGQPLQKMTALLEQSLEALREVVRMVTHEE